MSAPLVSICLPNLNTRPFLEERMESLFCQTLVDWELIICDSHSDDEAWEFFKQFKRDPRVRLCQVPREGLYAGWNECLKRVEGEYVYIATSDDTAEPGLLERLVGLLEEHRDTDLAVCRYRRIDERGEHLPDWDTEDLDRFLGDWLLRPHKRNGKAEFLINLCLGCHWNTLPVAVFRRGLLAKTGLFRTDCGSYADVAWRIKAVLNSDMIYTPECLAAWRWHSGQATARLPPDKDRLVYQCRRETVLQCDRLIPDRWKSDPRYLERILFFSRCDYLISYHLHRTALRTRPISFLYGCLRALRREPRYLLDRLTCGLSWDVPQYGDRVACLQALMKEWRVPWPPDPL